MISEDAGGPKLDPAVASQLRDVLDESGFDERGVLDALGAKDFWSSDRHFPPLILHQIEGNPLEPLMRLFVLRSFVEPETALKALAPISEDVLVRSGILEITDAKARSKVRILSQKGIFLTSDWPRGQDGLKKDYVMGMSPSSITVSNLGVRGPIGDYLDLGTGSGVLALLASEHCERVTATDLNARAVEMARFNVELNRMSNVECVYGAMYEPVEGRKFDAILTNPPYVISPDVKFQFMDSEIGGEEFCKQLVRDAPRFMNEGGWFQMACNWAERESIDWKEQLATWFEGNGCDVWVLRFERDDPAAYATAWIRQSEGDDLVLYEERYARWMKFFADQNIDSLSMGFVSMRLNPGAKNWFQAEDAPGAPNGPAGDQIRRVFAAKDLLFATSDEQLLDLVPTIAPEVVLEQFWHSEEDRLVQKAFKVSLAEGIPYWGQIDRMGAGVLANCDGTRTVRELLNLMATEMDIAVGDFAEESLAAIRNLCGTGLLVLTIRPLHPQA